MQRDALHDAAMDLPDRLKLARERRGFSTAAEAAEALGVPYGTYSGHESGLRGVKRASAERYASFFRVPLAWLLTGDGPPPEQISANIVPVLGGISAGGTFDSSAEQIEHGEPLYEIELPISVGPDAIAFEIKGESMWPRYDAGDVIVCFRRSIDPETMLGFEAAVGTPDGTRYLKRLIRGAERGLYTLESHNAPPIRDVELDWVSDVGAVVRAHQVRRITRQVREAVTRQLQARRRA